MLREHLLNYPAHSTAGAALYFSGPQDGAGGTARRGQGLLPAAFAHVSQSLLRDAGARKAAAGNPVAGCRCGRRAVFVRAETFRGAAGSGRRHAAPRPGGSSARGCCARPVCTNWRMPSCVSARARTRRLRCLPWNWRQAAAAPHQAMRIMKTLSPDYLKLPLDQAPRRYWNLLFPLPFRNDLEAERERAGNRCLSAGRTDPPGIGVRSAGGVARQGIRADASPSRLPAGSSRVPPVSRSWLRGSCSSPRRI